MLRAPLVGLICLTLLGSTMIARAGTGNHPRIGLILHDGVALRAKGSPHAALLASLVQQTQVEVLGKHASWMHVRIWAAVEGWVPTKEITFKRPWPSKSTYSAPQPKGRPQPYGPESLTVRAVTSSQTPLLRWDTHTAVSALPAGTPVTVTAWRQDGQGEIWYRIGSAWANGSAIRFIAPKPGTARVHGQLIWKPVTGKGMWLTLGTAAGASGAEAVVRAARDNGVTHLYVESGISPLGFHGRGAVEPLLAAAHRRHIAVLAWVYPYLDDVARDIKLTRQIAAYVSPTGDRFDGIACDIERNFSPARVRAYSQITRASIGNAYLLVGVTYPPQSFSDFPFGEVAASYNVIAPMDYWHQTNTNRGLDYGHMPYGYDYAHRYAADSVTRIRRLAGRVPIATIGQTFDDFGRLEMGPHAPSAAEEQGFLQGSKDAGAIGASFFQWMTATDGEWRAIRAFHY